MKETLTYTRENGYKSWNSAMISDAMDYAEGYKSFISTCKIEREVMRYARGYVENIGYSRSDLNTPIKVGDKVYFDNRGKCLAVVKVGKKGVDNGVRILIAHADSPRLDLKPNPLYEDGDTAYMKTHYYGGLRKYQWLTVPLAMHGTLVLRDNTSVDVNIGENASDPVFYISDLLPHLAHDMENETLSKAFPAERLNIVCGGIPSEEVDSEAVKYNTLKILNQKYGIVEEDLLSAEIEFVPTYTARDIGLDRAYIGAYGHDDKVCAYSALTAFAESNDNNTSILYLVDKEEIGSDGVTGAQSQFIADIVEKLAHDFGMSYAYMRQKSECLSADVTSAYDANFKDVFDAKNSTYLSSGVAINKYTGARGKSGASDATAEFTTRIKNIFNEAGVLWQTGEIGKLDVGGGGTVAKFLASKNIDTLDVGVPVMSMHSPFELISKVDLYSAYKGYLSFLNK